MESIFSVWKPFLTLMKTFGLFPMSFIGPSRNGVLKVKWHDIFLTCISFTLLVSLTVLIMILNGFVLFDSTFQKKAWHITVCTEFCSHIILFIYQIFKRKDIVNFIEQIKSFDEQVNIFVLNSNMYS